MGEYYLIALGFVTSIFGYFILTNTIYILAPTKALTKFPEKCNLKTNCTRVADKNTRGYGLRPIKVKGKPNDIQKKIGEIIEKETNMIIEYKSEGFMHCVDITPFFRFYDDITIRIFEKDKIINIWLQSQSRLGIYDFNVNDKRVHTLHKKITTFLPAT